MRTFAKLSLVTGALILSLSCGSTKQVQYVYVENPVYAPAPAAETATAVPSTVNDYSDGPGITVISSASNRNASSNSASRGSAIASAQQSPKARVQALSQQKVTGCYRGYGSYQSSDEDLAMDMAQTRALSQLSNRATTQIQRALENITNDTNSQTANNGVMTSQHSQTTNNVIRKIKQLVTNYTISDWRIIDSYISNGPMYEACYCVEAAASNIIADLSPLLNELDSSDRDKIVTIINQGYSNQ